MSDRLLNFARFKDLPLSYFCECHEKLESMPSRYVCEQRKSSGDDDRMRPFDLPCLRAVAMLSQWR